jgi:hypothetical protein
MDRHFTTKTQRTQSVENPKRFAFLRALCVFVVKSVLSEFSVYFRLQTRRLMQPYPLSF